MSRLWIAIRSVIYATLFLTLWTWTSLECRGFDKYHLPRLPAWLIAPGVTMLVVGAILSLTTVGFFIFEGYGTPAIFDPPVEFVAHGPNHWVRNPMYLGYVSVLLGLAFCYASAGMLLFSIAAFVAIHTFVVLVEEPSLCRRLGRKYQDYRLRVPRWVPRFSPRHPPR